MSRYSYFSRAAAERRRNRPSLDAMQDLSGVPSGKMVRLGEVYTAWEKGLDRKGKDTLTRFRDQGIDALKFAIQTGRIALYTPEGDRPAMLNLEGEAFMLALKTAPVYTDGNALYDFFDKKGIGRTRGGLGRVLFGDLDRPLVAAMRGVRDHRKEPMQRYYPWSGAKADMQPLQAPAARKRTAPTLAA